MSRFISKNWFEIFLSEMQPGVGYLSGRLSICVIDGSKDIAQVVRVFERHEMDPVDAIVVRAVVQRQQVPQLSLDPGQGCRVRLRKVPQVVPKPGVRFQLLFLAQELGPESQTPGRFRKGHPGENRRAAGGVVPVGPHRVGGTGRQEGLRDETAHPGLEFRPDRFGAERIVGIRHTVQIVPHLVPQYFGRVDAGHGVRSPVVVVVPRHQQEFRTRVDTGGGPQKGLRGFVVARRDRVDPLGRIHPGREIGPVPVGNDPGQVRKHEMRCRRDQPVPNRRHVWIPFDAEHSGGGGRRRRRGRRGRRGLHGAPDCFRMPRCLLRVYPVPRELSMSVKTL